MQQEPYPLSPVDEQASRLSSAFGGPPPVTVACAKHPGVMAIGRCHSCNIPICATCDFVSPGGFHLCPACALNPNPRVSAKRKKMVWWSVGLAIVALVMFGGSIAYIVSNPNDRAALQAGNIFFTGGFLLAVIGLGLGVASRDRRFKTPIAAWIGIVGNGAIVVIFLLLSIVGSLKG